MIRTQYVKVKYVSNNNNNNNNNNNKYYNNFSS